MYSTYRQKCLHISELKHTGDFWYDVQTIFSRWVSTLPLVHGVYNEFTDGLFEFQEHLPHPFVSGFANFLDLENNNNNNNNNNNLYFRVLGNKELMNKSTHWFIFALTKG